MKIKYTITILFILYAFSSIAQKELANWYFGYNNTLDLYNYKVDNTSAMRTGGSCASIATREGVTQFYTDGRTIWNKNNEIIGTGLKGGNISKNSCIISPLGSDERFYHIYTIDGRYISNWDSLSISSAIAYNGTYSPCIGKEKRLPLNFDSTLCYTLIDMRLNNGKGGIVAKNIIVKKIDAFTSMTVAKHANGRDNWLLTNDHVNKRFIAYRMSVCGIVDTVYSNMISDNLDSTDYFYTNNSFYTLNSRAIFEISPDNTKFFYLDFGFVYDFNSLTGVCLANPKIRDSFSTFTKEGFDLTSFPTSKVTYLWSNDSKSIVLLYDLLRNDETRFYFNVAVWNLENKKAREWTFILKNGRRADDKWGVSQPMGFQNSLEDSVFIGGYGIINLDNTKESKLLKIDLRNNTFTELSKDQSFVRMDAHLGCNGADVESDRFCNFPDMMPHYLNPKRKIIPLPKIAINYNAVDCKWNTISFNASVDTLAITHQFILGDSIISFSKNLNYNFQKEGTYFPKIVSHYQCYTDTFNLQIEVQDTLPKFKFNLQSIDVYNCDTPLLSVPNLYKTVLWNDGGNTNQKTIQMNEKTVWVQMKNTCGTIGDTIQVNRKLVEIPNIITPNNDDKNEYFNVIDFSNQQQKIDIYNRWGQNIFTSDNYLGNWPNENISEGIYYYDFKVGICPIQKGWLQVAR